MIKLTRENGDSVYVSPENIGKIEKARPKYAAEGTQVSFHGEMIIVKESPEKVSLMVLEYKLAMERFNHSYAIAVQGEDADAELANEISVNDLEKLAGLEETP